MTAQVVYTTSEVVTKLQTLAPEQQKQVFDFIDFLAQRYPQSQETPQQRVPDLNKGQIIMSDDFDDPLPDEFWLGEGEI
jgi:mRNA-degrading endonuclease RelE of RelBE toxin-antitoxin system